MKELKRVERIVNALCKCASKDLSRNFLQGIYKETYIDADHGFAASLTATDGHVLVSWYLNYHEISLFEKFIEPLFFNNGKNILFKRPFLAQDNKDFPYPEYRKVLPSESLNEAVPMFFNHEAVKRVMDFRKAVTGIKDTVYLPRLAGNTFENGVLTSATAAEYADHIILVMPLRIDFNPGEFHRLIPVNKVIADRRCEIEDQNDKIEDLNHEI